MKQFDELQKINRGKIAFQTLILTLFLIIANGLFKDIYGVWSTTSMDETLILITIPTLYFCTMAVFKEAYTYENSKGIMTSIIIFALIALMNLFLIINSIHLEVFKVIVDGKITSSFQPVITAIFFGFMSTLLLVKYIMNKKSK